MTIVHHIRRLGPATAGATAVEFAMIAVVLFVTLVGVIEIGRYVWTASTLERATQEAARYAYTGASDAQITQLVNSSLTGLDPGAVTVSVAAETVSGNSYKTIQASFVFSSAMSIIPIKGTITRRSRVPQ